MLTKSQESTSKSEPTSACSTCSNLPSRLSTHWVSSTWPQVWTSKSSSSRNKAEGKAGDLSADRLSRIAQESLTNQLIVNILGQIVRWWGQRWIGERKC